MNGLRLLRFERGLSARAAASGARVALTTLRHMERGKLASAPKVRAVAEFYGLPVAEVIRLVNSDISADAADEDVA